MNDRLAAVVAPAVGTGAYLAWVGTNFGDAFLPFKVQQQGGQDVVMIVRNGTVERRAVTVSGSDGDEEP